MNQNAAWLATAVAASFAGGFAAAQSGLQTGREPQFENADVKVWRTHVLPNNPLPFHRHEHPRVLVALAGGTIKILEDTGQSETHFWETGHAYWLPANRAGTLHQDVNVGNAPIDVVVVELQNAK